MIENDRQLRVVYSFPFRLGASRICYTAWQQVNGLAAAGVDLLVFPASLGREVPAGVKVSQTLALHKLRIPYRIIGTTAAVALHDRIVARRIEKLAGSIDLVHVWSLGACETLKAAIRLGIPTVLERPNAHTRFAYEIVQKECESIGVMLPPGHEHAYNSERLHKEEEEYRLATRLLCPSEFVVKTFLENGFRREQLVRHIYGYDESVYFPEPRKKAAGEGLTMLFVGVCAVRKGLHYALEAWLRSPASEKGTFMIAGEFLPAYRDKLQPMLSHPSVQVLGHRNDVPELMRKSDLLILPSIEEGFGLVIAEAMGSGCVPLASEACTDICIHMKTGMVHRVGNVDAIAEQITLLDKDRALLAGLRAGALEMCPEITWNAAGHRLLAAYRETLADYRRSEGVAGNKSPMAVATS
ncbi:MAG: glycosyltransferase family 4 protein [Acidobacteriaceae bacterium]